MNSVKSSLVSALRVTLDVNSLVFICCVVANNGTLFYSRPSRECIFPNERLLMTFIFSFPVSRLVERTRI
jgi:hypothetical protein